MFDAIVTTGRKQQKESIELAQITALRLKIPFVERKDFSIKVLMGMYKVNNVLIAQKNSLHLTSFGNEIFFHPSLSHLRIKNINKGDGDRLIEAMDLKAGMSVLDCTLGLGSDAIVESFIVGSSGNVIAIEINPLLAEVVRHGLKNFSGDIESVISAMRRVNVVNADYFDYLKNAGDNSFDIVYFDPMFRHPLERSSSLNPLRNITDHRPVSIKAIKEAKRVAKFRVVLKENAKSLEFERLGFNKISGGKYSPIHYGILKVN